MTRAGQETRTRERFVTRVFDAPVDVVWKYWTEPEYIKKWWGPTNFTAPTIELDFRVGGTYLYCMRGTGPDGVVRDFWNTGRHIEIIPHRKIVSTVSFADEHGNPVPASFYGTPGEWPDQVMLTVNFEEVSGGKTRVTVQETGIPDVMSEFATLGWDQQLDKVSALLK